jgi:hypothetical protein
MVIKGKETIITSKTARRILAIRPGSLILSGLKGPPRNIHIVKIPSFFIATPPPKRFYAIRSLLKPSPADKDAIY